MPIPPIPSLRSLRSLKLPLAAATAGLLLLTACSTSTARDHGTASASPTPTETPIKEDAPWVIGMGDSFMSGEAGRWATNSWSRVEPGWRVGTNEEIYGEPEDAPNDFPSRYCHRSPSAPMHIGGDYNSKSLACSGATTYSREGFYKGSFKPGLDFETLGPDQVGQAESLAKFAKGKDVEAITVSIGGNDLHFATAISDCLTRFLERQTACSEDQPASVSDLGSPEKPTEYTKGVSRNIEMGLQNIQKAMSEAGHEPGTYRIIFQLPPVFLPSVEDVAYDEGLSRQLDGGCGLYDSDLTYARGTLLPVFEQTMSNGVKAYMKANPKADVKMIDPSGLFKNHELCSKNAPRNKANDTGEGTPDWESTGKNGEWVRWISLLDQEFGSGDESAENAHPTYWGQLALRSCMRHGVESRSKDAILKCVQDGDELNAQGEPTTKIESTR